MFTAKANPCKVVRANIRGRTVLKPDKWIAREALNNGLIEPFELQLIRRVDNTPVISYGLSSYGYDIRLSAKEFKVYKQTDTVVDPKAFNPEHLYNAELQTDGDSQFFILPAHSYGLGVAKEYLNVPSNVTVLCIGKSTYARCGVIANLTPAEAGWQGHLTLEFSNSSGSDVRLYANEGVVQLLFIESEPCNVSYSARNGKYQNQPEQIVTSRI